MRFIDADALMDDINNSLNEMTNIGVAVDGDWLWAKLNDAIEHAPTIEPERKIGKWEPVEEIPSIRKQFKRYCCSNCKKEGFDTWNYCPECGQRNREVAEPEDIPMEYFESGGR